MIKDIIYLEDNPTIQKAMMRAMDDHKVSHADAQTLEELESILINTTAKAYIIDGNFPEEQGKSAEYWAPQAVTLIRMADKDANIYLLTADIDGDKKAKELNITYKDKGRVLARELIEEIKQSLD